MQLSNEDLGLIAPPRESAHEYALVRPLILTERSIICTVRDTVFQCLRNLCDCAGGSLVAPCDDDLISILTICPIGIAALCALRIYWTSTVEEAFHDGTTCHPDASCCTKLVSYEMEQSRVIRTMIDKLRGTKVSRKCHAMLVRLIVQISEQRDTMRRAIGDVRKNGRLAARRDFAWKGQIRYYADEKKNELRVAIIGTEEFYGFEYSSCENKQPIVSTPLTDRCYRSLAEAYRKRMYAGLVHGPGDTGKTHTIVSLARIFGVDLRILDCTQRDIIDCSYIDNIFRALIVADSQNRLSSCWLCFKHLDLLTIQGLSVIAQRIVSILAVGPRQQGTASSPSVFVIGTMSTRRNQHYHNPPLPDTLKVLFRPIAMAFPDKTRIVEVLFFANGFSTASALATKLHLFEKYSSSSQQSLFHRHDYDAVDCTRSMRTTMHVVRTACALKHRYPNEMEDALFLRTLVDVHLPKLTTAPVNDSDLRNFQHTIRDLFPNVSLPPPNYEDLLSAIRRITEMPDHSDDRSLLGLKIVQLFETLLARHAVIVIGSSLTGKTTVIDTLRRSLPSVPLDKRALHVNDDDAGTLLGRPITSVRINHNSFTNDELFGNYDDACMGSGKLRWKDGMLTRAFRSLVGNEAVTTEEADAINRWQWLIFDGPLDTVFLENIITLLDSNEKTLFLKSGERIRMIDSMSIILETSSTTSVTPATISHCGIIYLGEDEATGWKIQIRRWIAEHHRGDASLVPLGRSPNDDEYSVFAQLLLEWSLEACLNFVCENSIGRGGLPINASHSVISVLTLLEMHLTDALVSSNSDQRGSKSTYANNFFSWSQAALLMSIIWAIGGSTDRNSLVALDEFCKLMWLSSQCSKETSTKFPYERIGVPNEGLIQDYVYVFTGSGPGTGSGSWRHLSDILKKDNNVIDYFWSFRAGPTSYVPTIDSIRYINIFETHIKHRRPFFISGETATGKTLFIRHLLKTKMLDSESTPKYLSNFLTLAGDVSSLFRDCRTTQMTLLSKMKKISKHVWRSPSSDQLCVNFVDDLSVKTSVPAGDEVPSPILELIRQYYDVAHKCWYDVESGERLCLEDVMFLGAMDEHRPREVSSRWQETARFLRHFNLYRINRPSDKSIFRICYSILFANLRTNMFNADVAGSVTSMVNATVDVYSSISKRFRPIPARFQYHFSPRDVSRVIAGCSLIHKESAETKITLMRLWVHETLRVFADRIDDPEDAEWLFVKIRQSAESHFKDSWDAAFDNLPKNDDVEQPGLTRESFDHLLFSDFMRISPTDNVHHHADEKETNNGKIRYEEITCSREALRNRANVYLERYNNSVGNNRRDDHTNGKKKLDIIIFPELLKHLMRICRILDIPGGSLLIVRIGECSGTRSLAALAAHLKSQPFEELSRRVVAESTVIDSLVAWKNDLKRTCMNCCYLAGGDCTFFITDRQIIGANRSIILGDVCSLMKTGQVANLLTQEETDKVIEKSRLCAQRGDRNREISRDAVMDYYNNKCQEKLHFVLYFDRAALVARRKHWKKDKAERILQRILNHCSIDCYERWPAEAFSEIGKKFVRDIDINAEVGRRAIIASKYFYDSVVVNIATVASTMKERYKRDSKRERYHHRMPVSAYIHMVKLYGLLMKKRQQETRESRKRYLDGLDKLELAGDKVNEMKSMLTRLRPELEQSANETAATMRIIERENVSVENATIQVKREEEVANGIAEVAGILKAECEADLAVAIPILEDAIAALNTLKPTDITLVKAMKNPPDTVKLVLAAVCVMLDVAPDRSVDPVTGKKSIDYWAPSKRILGDMNFLQNLKDYDKDNIPVSIMSIVNKIYMNDETFQSHIVAKASSAAEGLCKWVRAMVSYDEVAKVVAPKKEKLAAAERECNASLEYLNEKRTRLAALNDKLAALNAKLETTLRKKYQLEIQVASCTEKLKRAEALITSLAGERDRWLESVETLSNTYGNLAGDILLSGAFIALLSSFDANHRDYHLVDWRNELDRLEIPNSGESYKFARSLLVLTMNEQHFLSVDDGSFFNRANNAILANSLLTPLILDPQKQANMWIKRIESVNGLIVVKPTDPRWFDQIRASIDQKLPVLLENLDRSEYLERALSIIDYVGSSSLSAFKLYMTSRISFTEGTCSFLSASHRHNHIEIMFQLYKRFNVVNFSLTKEALEERLLEIVVSRERPELRSAYDRLMISSFANRTLLEQEEDKILAVLSGTNIIEDERAIETLDRSKNLSLEIKKREAETARTTGQEMNEIRKIYRPLTKYCAALYDTLGSLVYFNHMYRFSLDWFVRLYVKSIDASMRSVVLEKRLNYLEASFTLRLEASVRNSLLDGHKLVYSFLLSMKILIDSNKITYPEIRALLLLDNRVGCRNNDDYDDGNLVSLARQLNDDLPNVFQNFETSFRQNTYCWTSYVKSSTSVLPSPWNDQLTDFQRLILVNRLKPETTLKEVRRFVENTLKKGSNSANECCCSWTDSVARSFDESSCVVPLTFVLPSYLDPYQVIDKWARSIGYSSNIVRFSMPPNSIGEHSSIQSAIEMAQQRGNWILLENCHLATDEWLAKLEHVSESLMLIDEQACSDTPPVALTFRLWLTSYPCTNFPISILHNSTKIHCERPSDCTRQNLLDFYATEPLDDSKFDNRTARSFGNNNNGRAFAKLVYSLCFFHAIVTGRNKFYERAWNMPCSYEFTDSDMKISIGQLRHRFLELDEYQRYHREATDEETNDARDYENLLETLVYLVGECYYGGRVIDPNDRNTLNVILKDCCNLDMVRATTNYVLSVGDGCIEYSIPNRSEYRDFVRHITDCIPNCESPPQLFGLNNNASIVRNRRNADHFIRSLVGARLSFLNNLPTNECNCHHANTANNDIKTTVIDNGIVTILEIIQDIRAKLSLTDAEIHSSHTFDIVATKDKYPNLYEEPLNGLLIEQVEFYNVVIELIRASLVDVENVYKQKRHDDVCWSMRTIIVDQLAGHFIDNTVPPGWCSIFRDGQIAHGCLKGQWGQSLSRFIDRLSNRRDFFNNWIQLGHYRSTFWLGGLILCRKFVSAARLTFARKCAIPLDRLIVDYEITNIATGDAKPWEFVHSAVAADDVVASMVLHVDGTYLSGARWDIEQSSLVESLPKVYFHRIPIIRFRPRFEQSIVTEKNSGGNVRYYMCPVNSSPVVKTQKYDFFGSLSDGYVMTMPLVTTEMPPEHWIKRATVLFCNSE